MNKINRAQAARTPKPNTPVKNGNIDLKYPVYFQMSSFPPADWEVRYLQDMDTFTVEPDGNKLCLAALLAVKPAGALEGNFRLTLTGTEDVSIRLNVADFIPHKASLWWASSTQVSRYRCCPTPPPRVGWTLGSL